MSILRAPRGRRGIACTHAVPGPGGAGPRGDRRHLPLPAPAAGRGGVRGVSDPSRPDPCDPLQHPYRPWGRPDAPRPSGRRRPPPLSPPPAPLPCYPDPPDAPTAHLPPPPLRLL